MTRLCWSWTATYLHGLPAIRDSWSVSLCDHNFAHVFEGRVWGYHVIVWQLIVLKDTPYGTAPGNLPQYQAKGIDICTLERLKVVHVDGFLQTLWRHVALCANTVVGCYVNTVGFGIVAHSKTWNIFGKHMRFVALCSKVSPCCLSRFTVNTHAHFPCMDSHYHSMWKTNENL